MQNAIMIDPTTSIYKMLSEPNDNVFYDPLFSNTASTPMMSTVTPISTSAFLVDYENKKNNMVVPETYIQGMPPYNSGYAFVNEFGTNQNVILSPTSPFTDSFNPRSASFSIDSPYGSTYGKVPIGSVSLDSVKFSPIGPTYERFISDDSSSTDTYRSSVDFSYVSPAVGFYKDLNDDPKIRKKLINHFHNKFLNDWLINRYSDLLEYFEIIDGRVNLRKPKKHTKKLTDKEINLIIDYIEKFFMTKSVTKRQLKHILEEARINWVKLPENKSVVRKTLYHKLKKLLRLAASK